MDHVIFNGAYVTDQLRRPLETVPATRGVVVTFCASGYETTVTSDDADGVVISASLYPTWARGGTYRKPAPARRAELNERLTAHGPTVWITVGNGPIKLGTPS